MNTSLLLVGLIAAVFGIWQRRNVEGRVKLGLRLRAINLRRFDLSNHPRVVTRAKWEARITILLGAILIAGGLLDLPAITGVVFFFVGFLSYLVLYVETV